MFYPRAGDHRCADSRVVFEEFFEAGAGNVGQLELGFLGGAAGATAFEDVLLARAGGLNHLVAGAAEAVDVGFHKTNRHIIHQ